MNKKLIFILLNIFSILILFSCKKDEPKIEEKINIPSNLNGIYITNEGNYNSGNAKISFYDETTNSVTEDLFQPANNRPLGDVCQSMYFFNGKIYLVINNSNKIEIVNQETFISTGTINGLTSPRYFLPVNSSKAYITDLYSNNITIVNLSNNSISGQISCTGWTEELLLSNGKVFVTNPYRNKVYIINTSTDAITDSITVGYGSNSITEDKNGKLWVLCSGDQASIKACLYRISPNNNLVEASFEFSSCCDNPSKLDINGTKDTLYFINNDAFRLSINATALPTLPFIAKENKMFYGIGIDPKSNIIYVSDAIDYVQKGVVYRYKSDGTLINSFKAGIIPGEFYFN